MPDSQSILRRLILFIDDTPESLQAETRSFIKGLIGGGSLLLALWQTRGDFVRLANGWSENLIESKRGNVYLLWLLRPISILLIRSVCLVAFFAHSSLGWFRKITPDLPAGATPFIVIHNTGNEDTDTIIRFCDSTLGEGGYGVVTTNVRVAATLNSKGVSTIPVSVTAPGKDGEWIDRFDKIYTGIESAVERLGAVKYRDVSAVDLVSYRWVENVALSFRILFAVREFAAEGVGRVVYLANNEPLQKSVTDLVTSDFSEGVKPASYAVTTDATTGERLIVLQDESSVPAFRKSGPDGIEKKLARICKAANGDVFCSSVAHFYYQLRQPYLSLMAELTLMRESTDRPVFIISDADPSSIYWKTVSATLDSLLEQKIAVVAFVSNYRSFASLMKKGVRVWFISPRYKNPGNSAACEASAEFMSAFEKFTASDNRSSGDIDFSGSLWRACFKSLAQSDEVARELSDAFLTIDLIEQAIKTFNPRSVFIVPHTAPLAIRANAIAKARNTTTVTAPSVTISELRISMPVNWNMDIVACYGEQCADSLRNLEHNSTRLTITGNASADELIKRKKLPYKKRDFDSGKKIILVATSRTGPEEDVWLDTLATAVEKRGDCLLVIKPHYNIGAETYMGLIEKSDNVRLAPKGVDIYDLILSSDLVVTDYSTVGAEAVCAEKPLVTVNAGDSPYPWNRYDEYGVAIKVTHPGSIGKILNKVLDDESVVTKMKENRPAFFNAYNYKNDGAAGKRIADILVDPTGK